MPSNDTMQEWLSPVSVEQNFTCFCLSICLSFNSCGTHLPTFRIFPISRRRLKTACWLTLNCSASRLLKLFLYLSSSSSNACNSTSSYFLSGFPCSLSATSKSPILKRWNHRSHVFCDGVCSHQKLLQVIDMLLQQFSSNEKIQNKKLLIMLSANAPYWVNFVILNTAT